MSKKHNSNSNSDKKFNFKEVTITFSPITALSFILLILSALYSYDKSYRGQEICELVSPIKQDDKYQWFSAPEYSASTGNYKYLDNGAFVYRHIFMDEFQEEFNVKPINFPVKHNLEFRLKNDTSLNANLVQLILRESERHGPALTQLKQKVEEGAYIDDGRVYIRWVNDIVRYGMFAGKDFKPGEVFGIYTGLITPNLQDLEYAWEFNYLVDLKDYNDQKIRACIDAKHFGNYMRFANHKDKNQNGGQQYVMHNGIWHVLYLAQAHIKANEQIFVNYGPGYWENKKKFEF
nr:8247_t:CDS:2 [Entrophospora candida]